MLIVKLVCCDISKKELFARFKNFNENNGFDTIKMQHNAQKLATQKTLKKNPTTLSYFYICLRRGPYLFRSFLFSYYYFPFFL